MVCRVGIDPDDDTGIDISHLDNVGILGFQAPPSIQITSAMRQAPSVSVTITVMTIRHSERQDSTWALQRLMHDQ